MVTKQADVSCVRKNGSATPRGLRVGTLTKTVLFPPATLMCRKEGSVIGLWAEIIILQWQRTGKQLNLRTIGTEMGKIV